MITATALQHVLQRLSAHERRAIEQHLAGSPTAESRALLRQIRFRLKRLARSEKISQR